MARPAVDPRPTEAIPERNERPWRFCGKCGSEMTWTPNGPGFDRETGRRVRIFAWSCPEWSVTAMKHDRNPHSSHQLLLEATA